MCQPVKWVWKPRWKVARQTGGLAVQARDLSQTGGWVGRLQVHCLLLVQSKLKGDLSKWVRISKLNERWGIRSATEHLPDIYKAQISIFSTSKENRKWNHKSLNIFVFFFKKDLLKYSYMYLWVCNCMYVLICVWGSQRLEGASGLLEQSYKRFYVAQNWCWDITLFLKTEQSVFLTTESSLQSLNYL